MRKTMWCGIVLVWGMAGMALGAVEDEETAVPGAITRSGLVTAVNAAAGTLELTGRNEETLAVRVTDETVVLIADEPGTLSDVKLQTRARVSGRLSEGALTARWVQDAATVKIREAESSGVDAVIKAVEAPAGTLMVETAQGKTRALKVAPEGRFASRIMKNGEAATLAEFAPEEKVRVAIRRMRGNNFSLNALAEPRTFVAFLARPTFQGVVQSMSPDGKTLTLKVEGQEAPLEFDLTRATQGYRQGAEAEAADGAVGETVWVVQSTKAKGRIRARAVFTADSWGAYADAELASEEEKASSEAATRD
jgi:hypothetical protein